MILKVLSIILEILFLYKLIIKGITNYSFIIVIPGVCQTFDNRA